MAITHDEVVTLSDKWARILELGDWRVYFATQDRVFSDEGVERNGQCEPDPRSLMAHVTISTINGNEETIIHELLHILTSELPYGVANTKGHKKLLDRVTYHDERVVTRLGRILANMEVKPDGN